MEQPVQTFHFIWLSPLGISVILFLVSGVLHLLIGSLTPFMLDSEFGQKIMFMSNRTDTQYFGIEPTEILRTNPEIVKLRAVLSGIMGGWITVLGLLIIAITWFGLRHHQMWALITLGLAGLIILPFWYLTFRPYLQAGISFSLSDIPPILWIPAACLVPAIVLGWIGLH